MNRIDQSLPSRDIIEFLRRRSGDSTDKAITMGTLTLRSEIFSLDLFSNLLGGRNLGVGGCEDG